jgi:hypothetical protein
VLIVRITIKMACVGCQDAVSNSFTEVLEKLYSYPELFNFSSLQIFVR